MRFKFFFSNSSFSCFSSSSCSWSSWTCWTKPPLPSKHFWFIDTFQVLLGTPSTVTMVRYNHYLNRVLTLRRHNSRYRRSVNHRLPCVSFTLTEPTFGLISCQNPPEFRLGNCGSKIVPESPCYFTLNFDWGIVARKSCQNPPVISPSISTGGF